MATSLSMNTSYAGESAGKYIGAGLLAAPTIANENVTVKPNVLYKQVVKTYSDNGIIKDATCDFTATSTVTIAERVLQPKELQINLQFCKSDFVQDWNAIELGYSANKVVPKTFSDFVSARIAEQVASANETSIWVGATGTSGQFNGFDTLIALDANLPSAQEVAGTTVTSSNVQAELGKIVDALPARLYGRPDLKLYVSSNIYRAYVRALGGFAASGVGANGVDNKGTMWFNGQEVFFDGIPVVLCPGKANNTAMLTYKDNLWFGTGLLSDTQEVSLIDMSPIDGSQNFRYVMRYTAGVQYGFAGDIVTYGITNSAN